MTRPNASAPSSIGALVHEAARLLGEHDPAGARLEAELLLAFVLGMDRPGLYVRWDEAPGIGTRERFRQLVERRRCGEPLAYLTGERDFMGLSFHVTPDVLVPRPETELLVETALNHLREAGPSPPVVDVGTGSGAIAVSLAVYHPGIRVTAVDISQAALGVARANASRHGVTGRVTFRQGDLLAGLPGPVDLVTANLPYIPTWEWYRLPREVRYEPRLALDGGPDGLDYYRRLVRQVPGVLRRGGRLLCELGPGQEETFLALVPEPEWQARVQPDLAGRPRLLAARYLG